MAEVLAAGGPLAAHLRYGLIGLHAGLGAALADHPDAAGAPAARALLADWAARVGPASDAQATPPSGLPATPPAAASVTPVAPAPAAAPSAEILAAAASALAGVPEFTATSLGRLSPATGRVALWRRLHLHAVRLAPPVAARWREQLSERTGAPPAGSDGGWEDLPGPEPLVLVPPFPGAAGIRVVPGAPPAGDVLDAVGGSGHDVAGLADLLTALARLAELDDGLRLCLPTIRDTALGPLDEPVRRAYRRELLKRVRRHRDAPQHSPDAFRALLAVDEAVHSVLHLPPAESGSWFATQTARLRNMVYEAERTHPRVTVQLLTGSYRSVVEKRLTDDDVGVRGDRPGDIVTCLRLWARVVDDELKGRVVYTG